MKIYYDHLLPPNTSVGHVAPSPPSSNLFTRRTHKTGPAIGFQNLSKSTHKFIFSLSLISFRLDVSLHDYPQSRLGWTDATALCFLNSTVNTRAIAAEVTPHNEAPLTSYITSCLAPSYYCHLLCSSELITQMCSSPYIIILINISCLLFCQPRHILKWSQHGIKTEPIFRIFVFSSFCEHFWHVLFRRK